MRIIVTSGDGMMFHKNCSAIEFYTDYFKVFYSSGASEVFSFSLYRIISIISNA